MEVLRICEPNVREMRSKGRDELISVGKTRIKRVFTGNLYRAILRKDERKIIQQKIFFPLNRTNWNCL